MKNFILATFALILLSLHSTSASGIINRDSLRAIVFDRSLPDSTRLMTGSKFVNSFLYSMPDSILHYSRILYEESVKADYKPGMILFKDSEGWYYYLIRQNNEALKYFLDALTLAEDYGEPRLLAYAYREVGVGYLALSMWDKAGDYLLQAIKIYREINDMNALQSEIIALSNLAGVYSKTEHLQKSIEASLRVITLIDSLKSGSTEVKASALRNLGPLYMKTGKPQEAIRSYYESLQIYQQNNNPYYYYETLGELDFYFTEDSLNQYGKVIGDDRKSDEIALAYLGEIESMARSRKDSSRLAQSYALEAKVYLNKGDKKKALEKIKEVEGLYGREKNPVSRSNLSVALFNIYEACGDYPKALAYYKKYVINLDSMNKVEMSEKVSQLTESFEIEQMQGQLSQKEQELTKNRMITYLFIAISGLILILAGIIFYFLRQKQKVARLLEQQNKEIEKARHRAEQGEKFKERFMASMSHEIRTPLNAVIGMTDLLLDDLQPPKTETFLRNIKQAGEHLTGIINQVLDLSRIDAGKLELHEVPFSMQELMDEIGNLLGVKAKEKELQLIILKGEGTPDWFYGDAGRIRQVLLNLAGNAIKFTEQGSVQIKMTAEENSQKKTMVSFRVEDTGVGIPKELQTGIFEEFAQASRTEDQRIIGTGLGLSIARKLVERMGGILSLDSEPGKGSVFSFAIPLELSTEKDYQALEKEKELSALVMKGSFRILVVEDNPSNQIVTEGLLEKILPESSTILAEDGFKALALLEKEKFDLVLMDIRMPSIDGYETTRRLRLLDNENAHIPVIALTASVIRTDIEHCLEAGMNGYVPKPVSRTLLAKILHQHLKTVVERGVIKPERKKENFLSGITDRPAWSDRLYETCNGKKERLIKYLEAFLAQSDEEIEKWQEWMDKQHHEPLAFSVHKLLPYIREFMDEKHTAMAVLLDQELRSGWFEGHAENFLSLKKEITLLQKEVLDLLTALG